MDEERKSFEAERKAWVKKRVDLLRTINRLERRIAELCTWDGLERREDKGSLCPYCKLPLKKRTGK